MGVTAVQSNSQPAGGMTATQPVPPSMTPADIAALVDALTPAVAQFRQQSTPMQVPLNAQVFTAAGQSMGSQIASVGLGWMLEREHNVTITIDNTATSAQVVDVSPLFPFNLLNKTQVEINGGATVYNVSGIGTLAVMSRMLKGFWSFSNLGGFGPALNPSQVRVAVTGGTVTNATSPTLSGIASISIAASTTCTITVTFYEYIKLALDADSLLGALPLQNNSTYAVVTGNVQNAINGTTPAFPVYVATTWPTTATVTFSDTVNQTYDFWSIPPQPQLYQQMVQNSYQVQEASSLTVSATGTGALSYNLPQNAYQVAAHIWGFDSTGTPLAATALSRMLLQYNAGSVVPVVKYQGRDRARSYQVYEDDRQGFPGYRVWDGNATTNDISDADNAGWVDTYAAATPQLLADVASEVSVPITYSVTREAVVASAVQVVGG